MKISILGYGTVGSGLIELLDNNKNKRTIEIEKILVKNKSKHVSKKYFEKVTDNIEDIFKDDIDVLVEVMGDMKPSFEYIKRALKNNIHVVTANKDLIAEHGGELIKLAKENNVNIKFEASVAGGIPIIKPLIESLEGNNVESISSILNGTTNFILSNMHDNDLSYDEALKRAQELGFAEANPESDVKGYDAARKLSILSTLAYDNRVYWKDLYLEGITNINEKDIQYAKQLNCKIKLVAQSKYNKGCVNGFVRPVLVDNNNVLANINNEFNGVILNCDSVGEVSFLGKGAGRLATGSAVYGDILDILDDRKCSLESFTKDKINIEKRILTNCSALLRFKCDDKSKLLEIIKVNSNSYDIVDEQEELVLVVNANSEQKIDESIRIIKDLGYSDKISKLIKI